VRLADHLNTIRDSNTANRWPRRLERLLDLLGFVLADQFDRTGRESSP